jgi:type I restriction enzyme, S subunit
MNKQTNKLIPELRFPEFVNEGEWELNILGEISNIVKGEQLNKIELTEFGKYPCQNGGIYPSGYTYKYNTAADTITISEGGNSCGYVNFMTTKFWLGGHCYKLLIKETINKLFLYQILKFNEGRLMKLRVGSGLPNIQLKSIRDFEIIICNSPFEQQKIASCLSSLDEVISFQTDKLETLKTYKKGLMQNLFPQEDEKVPKIRFKEFEKDGEWLEKTIDDVAKVTTGNKDTQNKVEDGKYPFFVRSQTVERINSFSYDGEAILTSGDGVGVGKNFHYINGKFDYHQRVYCIYSFSEEVSGEFVYMYFSHHFNERVMKMSAKNSVDSVRMAMITEMPIKLPSKTEQQKIADTLSSLDNLIKEQNNKIEQLKLHKKGLMQGLFPKLKN